MIALKQAVATLDGVIPPPDNKMVDVYHMPIAVAWQECKKALATYEDMKDKHDTLMRRWETMVETIRRKIDAGTLTIENSQLLDELNLPHGYDKRIPAARDIQQDNAPLTLEELEGMVGEPLYVIPAEKDPDWKPCWVICMEDYILVHSSTSESRVYFLRRNKEYGKTWLAYRKKPEVCGK